MAKGDRLAVLDTTAYLMGVQIGVPRDTAAAIVDGLTPVARMDGRPYYDPDTVSRAMSFALGLKRQAELEGEAAAASAILRDFPGAGSGAMGLTPDAIKFSPEYRAAREGYASAAARLAQFNSKFCQRFKAELSARRMATRQQKGGCLAG